MLICEARHELEEKLKMLEFENRHFQGYKNALIIAINCIDKQLELIQMLDDWNIEAEIARNDTYSAQLVFDIVSQFCIYDYEAADPVDELNENDTIKCHDKYEMVRLSTVLAKEGIETDFLYEKDGKKGLWLIVTKVGVENDRRTERKKI